ncbi:hypothetical protein AAGW05_10545 [Arthrobacter sp. LAPM80]|uniref:hypothetical protein n=1 Tax=Arthrobacter sp. LAPM80 TaxID=3141788 RepID=UPI00398B34E9
MAHDGSHDSTGGWYGDHRALRFALIFPALLSVALVAGGLLLGSQLQEGIVLPPGGNPVPLATFLGVGVAAILVLGAGLGSFGARTTLSRMLRRILLGLAMALQLAACTLFAATLLAQAGQSQPPVERVDGYVLLMGCGLAAAMGVVLALTFKPEEQWSPADDEALAAVLADAAEDPAAKDTMAYFVRPRGSVIMMILLGFILPGVFLALILPWILPAAIVAALLAVGMLSATVRVDRRQLTVKLLGVVPVLVAPCEGVDTALSLDIIAGDYGGWGLRRHGASASFLAYSGAAVVLHLTGGASVVVSAPSLDMADDLSAILNRRAGKTPGHR